MKKQNIKFAGIAVISSFIGCSHTTDNKGDKNVEENSKKPNVLILFADQHNKNVMGYEGHPDVITPNLDKLASESVVFDRAYCSTGISAPSRSSLMTGLYSRTLGLLTNSERTSVMNEVVSLATVFKQNDYDTYAFGKRHTDKAIDEGWDVKKSHLCNESPGDNYVTWIEEQGLAAEFAGDWAAEFGKGPKCSTYKDTLIPTADLGTRISKLPENATMEAWTARLTIDMLKNRKNTDKPFFCWATFYRPHQPYNPLKKYMDMYDVSEWGEGTKNGSSIKMPESFYEPTSELPPFLQNQRNGGNKVWNMDKAYEDEQIWRNYIGAYYALVTEIDYQVGQILQALSDAGIEEETIVIYTSDHGDFAGNHGMVEKAAIGHNVYEDILNIPLIIKYPGKFQKGQKVDYLVGLVDIFPTLVDLIGLDVPELKYQLQGKSLAGVLTDNEKFEREYFVSENWSQASVITKDYKLGIMLDPTEYASRFDFREFGDMFYVRKSNPLETGNQINDEKYTAQIQQLRKYYEDFKSKIPDTGKQEMIKKAKEQGM